ncbi:PoNi-like cognate immunity protein [Snodgrassella communis]|uniref:PoNi-like cognate immunity protein n=1 Tax=Snodgrassella communis TaxID=2946699 RepID=UPI001EF41832|nr:PoNi-like cognate immunity protein [Snodgrassella communis]
MKLRDKLNSLEGYQEIIDKTKSYTEEFKEKIRNLIEDEKKGIQKHPKPNNEIIEAVYEDIFIYQSDILIAKYSMGQPISSIMEEYKITVSYMEKGWKAISGYIDMVWMLSIGIMLEAEPDIFEKLKSLVERDHLNDYLVDFLLQNSTQWRKQTAKFEFPRPYKATQDIISLAQTDKTAALERLKKYLQKEWYRGHSDTGWHDDHKNKWNIHTGYWCFESGALVKILGLDDTALKDQPYYPYDMVHWEK